MKNYNVYELLYLYHSGSLYASDLIQQEMKKYLYYWTEEKVILNQGENRMYFEDLYQEAVLGLYEAIDTYREDKETSFITFSKRIVESKIINFISRTIRGKGTPRERVYSLDEESIYTDECYLNLSTKDYLSMPEYKLAFNECKNKVDDVISAMSVSERRIMDTWIDDLSYKEGSELLNMNYKKYDGKLQKVKKVIRNACKNQYSA